ncbi:unnamed protein product [Caenorhabditis bovis]|uniref:Uncharacterized protein n=1 Tax=Caenorhabditis bovis TaxID=2654633 RepID=A0A8S1F9C0_9PELO|nr:unnamed protein product [Caenorhabditis bovis]
MSFKIVFEQIESSSIQQLSECDLQSFSYKKDAPSTEKPRVLHRNQKVGTDVAAKDKACGRSVLKVNVATSYEFQKLNATQIHRAINDPKLAEFLNRVYPILKEELDDSELFNKL